MSRVCVCILKTRIHAVYTVSDVEQKTSICTHVHTGPGAAGGWWSVVQFNRAWTLSAHKGGHMQVRVLVFNIISGFITNNRTVVVVVCC
jgi:hypothetical protein